MLGKSVYPILHGATGATGATGALPGVYGTFVGFNTGTYQGPASIASGTVLPVTEQTTPSVPGQFTVNPDGTVTVNRAGTYLVTGKVQVQPVPPGTSESFGLQVNHAGTQVSYYNATTVGPGSTAANITTVLQLNAGDNISMGLVSPNTTTLATVPGAGGTGSPSVAITAVQIA